MIYQLNDQVYDFSDVKDHAHVGIKLSGGTDSAMVAYMLWKSIAENQWSTKITAMTTVHQSKAFQQEHSQAVLNWLAKQFPTVCLNAHVINQNPSIKIDGVDDHLLQPAVEYQELLANWAYQQLGITGHFSGLTCNPPRSLFETWCDSHGEVMQDSGKDRDRQHPPRPQKYVRDGRTAWRPLENTDKRGVAQLYDYFGIRELYSLTFSCEKNTWPMGRVQEHCDDCWFCKERLWGFGSYT